MSKIKIINNNLYNVDENGNCYCFITKKQSHVDQAKFLGLDVTYNINKSRVASEEEHRIFCSPIQEEQIKNGDILPKMYRKEYLLTWCGYKKYITTDFIEYLNLIGL